MPDNVVKWLIDATPCVGLVAGKYTLDYARIAQAVIVALVLGLLINVMMIPKIQVMIEDIRKDISENKQEIEKIKADFYKPQVSE